ncbi:unnamed protein product [Ilex paraguariensis]|uniref:non-specific serine/threonine protein kinase n=1 Tax=Ilex paraguariensis TaxID=185542 RepID=A0ABC8SEE2_9AQUA
MEPQNNISNAFCSSLLLFSMNLLFLQHVSTATHLGNETDRLALLEFKHQVVNYRDGTLNSWNDSLPHCQWQGVTCSYRHQRVTALNLRGHGLVGSISPHIGNLTFLRFIDLRNNSFNGEIPQEVGRLFRLRHLNLTNNAIGGAIPVNLSRCSELRIIELATNNLVGKIPPEMGSLNKLVTLFLRANNLTGSIPHSVGNLSSLEQITVTFNNLEGSLPIQLGQLKRLTYLSIGVNHFSGMVPQTLYNISTITSFSVGENLLKGSLPANIGLTLPRLQVLGIGANQFSGTIPYSITNVSELQVLDLPENNVKGPVPNNLGDLKNLRILNVGINLLGTNTSQDLSFITSLTNCSNLQRLDLDGNNFGGELPNSIGNFSHQLTELGLGRNQISGIIPQDSKDLPTCTIPSNLGKLQRLQQLLLYGNRLSGQIPPSLGNLSQMYSLFLAINRLEGNIPSSIGNCQNLQMLELSQNRLTGIIPKDVMSFSSLSKHLNLSQNSLNGSLPQEVGKLRNINTLDISNNKLSGEIPGTIGDCSSLEYLNMQGNLFEGTIPLTLASLKGIQHLDLSGNNMSGEIPKDLGSLRFLQYLNLSFNELEGEVPTKGVFKNASAISVVGNTKLCGGILELNLPPCPTNVKKHGRPKAFKIGIIVGSVVLFSMLMMSFGALCFWRKERTRFSSGNLIGSGSFGSVYKGSLQQGKERLVAVKVLELEKSGASKSFAAECRALRNIRHRNLVKILSYCSSIDSKGNEFKALVYEFMENGSLDSWLHPEIVEVNTLRTLNLLQRLNIAIDVSSALHYLHNHCETPVIHCDLKPSNILLDNDLTAHVGDFGLARLHSGKTNDILQQQNSSIGVKGSIGYAAPGMILSYFVLDLDHRYVSFS